MIIVTGGAGFIGSNIVKGLNKAGMEDIIIVDNLKSSEKFKNLSTLSFADFIDKLDLWKYLSGISPNSIEAIFHQGACTNTMEYNGRYMMSNNYEYSKNLLNFAAQNHIRFVYASSAAVYGLGKHGFKEDKTSESPLNIYGFSKVMFDRYVRRLLTSSDVHSQIVGLRYFNIYGPGEYHKGKMASIVLKLYKEAKSKGKMFLFEGSENYKRDFTYVKDVINVNLYFFNHPEISGIFNCGSGKAESFLQVANYIKKNYKDVSLEFTPFPTELHGKYQYFTEADLSNLRKAGYKAAFTPLQEGIKAYIQQLNNLPEGLFDI